jgi:hypothetical protein
VDVKLRQMSLREWVVLTFLVAGVGLLPWTVWLLESLKPHHVTTSWDLAWSGFDTGLALLFIATGIAAWRRSPSVAAFAAATGTVLVVDAWFDCVLESHWDERLTSILMAVFVELPAAAVCFWIAYRAERFLARVVEEASHLPAAGEGAAEGDLVGVLEITADGKPARKAGDPHPSP